ncbi:general stress protein [Brevibacterium oceani]|uniref:general stress protein n=1 Tax=Brevibacterium oceani TaxID=358099 RepID=UPI0015E6C77E|nr:general stress protein [Brevibacterium oceani]
MGSNDDLNSQQPDVTSQKPIVKAFHDDIGVLNHVQKLASEGVPKRALHIFAHDAEGADEVVGTGAGGTLKGVRELVAERYNERDDELRERFQRYGFDSDEIEKFECELDNGAILLVIDEPDRCADYKGKRRTP